MQGGQGLPGLRGADHVGITVPDLEAASAFLVDVLGAEPFFDLGPAAAAEDGLAARLGVDPSARLRKVRFLRLGHGLNIELFEYEVAGQLRMAPRNSDVGGHHLALYVDDMAAAVAHLHAHGVEVMGEPLRREAGPNGGLSWVYFRTPWGLQMELVSYPEGRGYERMTARRLWDPRAPGR